MRRNRVRAESRHVDKLSESALLQHLRLRRGYAHLSRVACGVTARRMERLLPAYWRRMADIRMIPVYVENGTIMEVGCGNGGYLRYMKSLGWNRVQGVELVSSAVQVAREGGVDVACGRAEDALVRYPDGHFDVIVAAMVLEHMVDPFSFVQLVARKLKSGGQFLGSTVIRDSLDGRVHSAYAVAFDFRRHMLYFTKADLRDLLARSFASVRLTHQSAPVDFVRPAKWRVERGSARWIDRALIAGDRAGLPRLLTPALAMLGLTGRVSFSCCGMRGPQAGGVL